MITSIMEEIHLSLSRGYLSKQQVKIVEARKNDKLSYNKLIEKFGISRRTALVHCLIRTCSLLFWNHGMTGEGNSYLSQHDEDLFFMIIGDAADDCNCIPCMYAVSLAYYIKKRRNSKAYFLLKSLGLDELASRFTKTNPPCKSWIYGIMKDSDFKIVTGQTIEFDRRHSCDVLTIYSYFQIHQELFRRHPCLILNVDETMLTAKRRLKVLARNGKLPLIPDAVKVPHFTGCVTFSASGFVFDPLIILPNKKTLRTLQEYTGLAYFSSSTAWWMTSQIFIYYSILLICQLSSYRLTLPENLRNERILLLSDGHPSRFNFTSALIFYLFNVDLVLIPPHTSHLLQAFDVAVASPLKANFKEEIIKQRFDLYLQQGFDVEKQTRRELRDSLIKSFINSLRKSCTTSNISSGFKMSGIVPVNVAQPLSSDYAMTPANATFDNDDLYKDYWINNLNGLQQLFLKEKGRQMTENDFTINLHEIFQNLKKNSVEAGLALSDLPPLFDVDGSIISGIRIYYIITKNFIFHISFVFFWL